MELFSIKIRCTFQLVSTYVGNDKEKTREWYFSYIEKLREDIDNKKYFNNEL